MVLGSKNSVCQSIIIDHLFFLILLQFSELETLGFLDLHLFFFEEDMHWAGTSNTVECSTDPKFTEYLHAVVLLSVAIVKAYT